MAGNRLHLARHPPGDTAAVALGLEHGDDLLRRSVAKQLAQFFFMPSDAVALNQLDKMARRVAGQHLGIFLIEIERLREQISGMAGVDARTTELHHATGIRRGDDRALRIGRGAQGFELAFEDARREFRLCDSVRAACAAGCWVTAIAAPSAMVIAAPVAAAGRAGSRTAAIQMPMPAASSAGPCGCSTASATPVPPASAISAACAAGLRSAQPAVSATAIAAAESSRHRVTPRWAPRRPGAG
jgi:hypothetical protein